MNRSHTAAQFNEASDAIASMLSKLAKSKQTLEAKGSIRPGSSQQTLIDRRIAALTLAADLIQQAQVDNHSDLNEV
ncbi:MAG: hypothetical protein FWD63_05070 [Propionibacteriaceae bacterium]|nr:hypothetical protein [Propionibacteriaceae bacterium]